MKTFYNVKTQAKSDTVNAVDRFGETRTFVGFIPDTDGAHAVVLNDPGTDEIVSIYCLAGHYYPIQGVRINSTNTASTNYTAFFTDK